MSNKICLLIATKVEAAEIIKSMRHVENTLLPYYHNDQFEVVITGMGHRLSQEELFYILGLQAKQYWNLGICGCLKNEINLFELCMPSHILFESEGLKAMPPILCNQNLTNQNLSLMTLSEPLHGGEKRENLKQLVDLVDMEAYHMVIAMEKIGLRCNVLKCVSDYCMPGGSDLIKKNLPKASFILRTALETIVSSAKF